MQSMYKKVCILPIVFLIPVAFLRAGRHLYVWADSVTLQSCLSEAKSSSYTSWVKVRGI